MKPLLFTPARWYRRQGLLIGAKFPNNHHEPLEIWSADKSQGGPIARILQRPDKRTMVANSFLISAAVDLYAAAKLSLSEDPGDWKSVMADAIHKVETGK